MQTRDCKLVFTRDGNCDILGFSDSSWASRMDEWKSVSGYVSILQGGAVSWRSKRQDSVSRSSTEAEYIALSDTTQEAIWLHNFCAELKIVPSTPIMIFCDNKGALSLAKNGSFSSRTKHINVAFYFVKEKIDARIVQVEYISTKEMVADMLTKAANQKVVEMCVTKMGIRNLTEKKKRK